MHTTDLTVMLPRRQQTSERGVKKKKMQLMHNSYVYRMKKSANRLYLVR